MTKKRKPLQNKDPRLCDKKLKLLEKERLNKNEVGELLAFDSQEFGLDSSGEESTDSKNENAEEHADFVEQSMDLLHVILKKIYKIMSSLNTIYFNSVFLAHCIKNY